MKREYYISQLLKADTSIPMANAAIEDANRTAKIVINKIYDDFDSRVCENCRYLKESKCNLGIYHFGIDTDPNIFGCNKFEINQ